MVYDARWVSLDRRVALKVPSLNPESELALRSKRFLRESQVLASLYNSSPANVPKLYMVATYKDQPYYARELVDGDTLEHQAATWSSNLPSCLRIVADVARGVQWVHERGLVHRNISSANVLVDGSGRPRLIGFGRVRRKSTEADVNIDIQGLRDLLQSVHAALGYRMPARLEHACGLAITAKGIAEAVAGHL